MGRQKAKPATYVTTRGISRQFCFSGFGQYADYKAELVSKLIDLGATYYESESIPSKCTHLICDQPSKNKKFLGACAAGLWVLSLSYIQDSHKARKWLLESDYELSERSSGNDLSFMHLAPKRCRLQVQRTGERMFYGWVSVVISDNRKRKSSYTSILKLGGSKIKEVPLPLSFPDSLEKDVTHIFVDKHLQLPLGPLPELKNLCLNADYIRNFLLLDPVPHPKTFAIASYIPNTDAVGVLKLRKVEKMPTKKLIAPVEGHIVWPLPKLLSTGVKNKLNDSFETSEPKKRMRLSSNIKRPKGRPCKRLNGDVQRKFGETKCCKTSPTSSPTASCNPVRLIQPSIDEFFKLRPCTVKLTGSDMIDASEFVAPNNKTPSKNNVESRLGVNSEGADNNEKFLEKENLGPFRRMSPMRGQSPISDTSFSVEDEVPAHRRAVMMPTTIVNIFNVWISEDKELEKSIKFLKLVVSERWYPPASVISTVILGIMLDPGNTKVERECVLFLKDLLFIHPPVSATINNLYLEALCLNKNDFLRKPWEAVSEIIQTSISLKKKSTGLLSFVVDLLEENFLHFRLTTTTNASANIQKQSNDLLVCAVFWNKKDLGKVNYCCRELLEFYGETVKDDELFEVQMLLQRLITIVAECFSLADSTNSKMSAKYLTSRCAAFANAFVQASLESNNSSYELRKCLSSLKPHWLRRHVSEILLRQLASHHWMIASQPYCECLKDIVNIYMKNPDFQNGDRHKEAARKECYERYGKYVIRPELVNKSNCKGETTLHMACAGNRTNRVKELLKVPGIDVNVKDGAGWTPLHEAANHGNTECVRILLECSAAALDNPKERLKVDVYATNSDGITALHDAVINNHVDTARVLLQYGGGKLLNTKSLSGYSALDLAESEEMMTLLKNPPLKLQPSAGAETPPRHRTFASRLSDEECSKYLLLLIHLLDSYFNQNHTKHIASALQKLCGSSAKVVHVFTNPDVRGLVRNLATKLLKYEPSLDDLQALTDDLHTFQRMDYFIKCLTEHLEPLVVNKESLKNDIDILQFVTSC